MLTARDIMTEGVITIAASDGGTAPTDPTDPGSDAPTLNASSSFRLGAGSVTLTGTATANTAVELWGRTVNSDGDGDYAKISDATASSSGTFAASNSRWRASRASEISFDRTLPSAASTAAMPSR